MITLTGTITVKTINGRNGDFNVGRLTTGIGEFNVKEGIEEYAPGQYAGQFSISRIYPAAYAVGGRYNVEVRATVDLDRPDRHGHAARIGGATGGRAGARRRPGRGAG
jgi:hypothetical protein